MEDTTVAEDNVQGSNRPPTLVVVIMTIYLVSSLPGVIGNGLVIWFGIFRMKKTVNVVWFLSLAVADFSFTFSSLLESTEYLINDKPMIKMMCKVNSFFQYMNLAVSVFQITVISVDRCICVVFPVWCHNHRRPRLAFIIVLIMWIFSFSVTIPLIIHAHTIDFEHTYLCLLNMEESTLIRIKISEFIVLFLLPFIIIVSCYIVIVIHVRRKRLFASSRPLKTIVAVIISFFICCFPRHLIVLLAIFASDHIDLYGFSCGLIIAPLLIILNSSINPILYVFIGRDFKEKFCGSFQAMFEKAFMEEDKTVSENQERSTALQSLDQDCKEEREEVIG